MPATYFKMFFWPAIYRMKMLAIWTRMEQNVTRQINAFGSCLELAAPGAT
jgi:hypothetical protein